MSEKENSAVQMIRDYYEQRETTTRRETPLQTEKKTEKNKSQRFEAAFVEGFRVYKSSTLQ